MIKGHKRATRRKERERALQMLYRLDISGWQAEGGQPSSESRGGGSYALTLAEGVSRNLAEIDRLIDRASTNWTMARMAVVDRNILRLAVYELLYHQDVPCRVVMDEAVELAGRFGAENSASFINGVIDRAYKDILSWRSPSGREAGTSKDQGA